MELPRISIVTPSFNQAQFLEATIRSVLDQGYPNLEYVVVDGGSTDGSAEIIERYADRLAWSCSEKDAGHYDAVRKGFSHCTGEIFAWLNSDDLYFSGALRTVASVFSELPQVEWITSLNRAGWDWYGYCTMISPLKGCSKQAYLDGHYLPSAAVSGPSLGPIQQESTFWRRSLWEKAGGLNPEYGLAADFDLWSRFYRHTDLYGVRAPLGGFRDRQDQRSVSMHDRYVEEARDSLRKLRDAERWEPSRSRQLAMAMKVDRIPGVRSRGIGLYGYTGKRVERRLFFSPEAHWEVEDHLFGLC
jgi:glycosyltransferase involved in cell wall biosynthesis